MKKDIQSVVNKKKLREMIRGLILPNKYRLELKWSEYDEIDDRESFPYFEILTIGYYEYFVAMISLTDNEKAIEVLTVDSRYRELVKKWFAKVENVKFK